MLRLIVNSLRMPLHSKEERKCGIFHSFNDSVRRLADDAQSFADVLHRLLVTCVHADLVFSDDRGRQRLGIERYQMPIRRRTACTIASSISSVFAMLDGAGAIKIRQELNHAPAAMNVHQLRAEANSQ